ncbi:unnamed protein product [Adineta ricciae]|uniref:WD repeat-containing protein 54 beta-propeller domain-containing protein n=1 Tax=Adineta ricciae TaxID=249248 RepID=A0A814A4I0_ADIRI|nr:unnamed protein product [Adineta ricciae]CAF0969275.1 unnamed protein product [Adineta ricciae]
MPLSYTKSSQLISVKWSASHFPNNLTVLRSAKSRMATYGVSHKSGFAMVTVSEDGKKQIHGQVITRAIGTNNTPAADNDARYIAHVVQAAFISLPVRSILVLACTKSIQIYDPEGTANLHIHMLDKTPPGRIEASTYSRGIVGISQNLLCVGIHNGDILVFNIPPKGTNIFVKETLSGHQCGITGLVANDEYLVSSDTSGMILIWNVGTMSQISNIQPTSTGGITTLAMWKNCVIAGYANGMIQIFDVENAQIVGSITAHSRCINAIDCNDEGLVASVSDDCYVRVWQLTGDAEDLQINHECNHQIENSQLVGVKFLHSSQADIAISMYDSNEVIVLRA